MAKVNKVVEVLKHMCKRKTNVMVLLPWMAVVVLIVSINVSSAEDSNARAFPKQFSFVVVGDSRSNEPLIQPEVFKTIIEEIGLLRPAFVVNVGDMILGGTDDEDLIRTEWAEYKKVVADIAVPYYQAAGNHDVWDQRSEDIYKELFGAESLYYSLSYGNSHFVVLNTEMKIVGGQEAWLKQLKWLENELNTHRDKEHIFVFFHKPMFVTFRGTEIRRYHEWQSLFVKHKVSRVFAGHVHNFHQIVRDGVIHTTTGGGGSSIHNIAGGAGNFHHYLNVTVDGKDVHVAILKPGNILSAVSVDEARHTPATEHAPDYRTLFLAHYNGGLDADYSAGGATKAEVVGAKVTEGGQGHPFAESKPSPEAVDVGYSGNREAELSYPAEGNIYPRQGTIEFCLKTAWDWDIKEVPKGNPWHVSVPLPEGGLIRVYTYVHAASKQVSLGLHIRDAQGDHVITYNASPVKEGKSFWKKDEWHHVGASWNAKESRLFLDGRLVAEKSWEPNLSLPPFLLPDARITVGGRPGRAARVLIDELRITDSVNVYGP